MERAGTMASENIIELNDTTFDEAVASGTVLVDFWAPWCGPCRMQGQIVEEVAEKVGDAAVIAKVNVDDAPQVAQKFRIRAIPTIIVFRDGEVAKQFVGVQNAASLLGEVGVS